MAELLKDEEFCRWVKSLMALEMTRTPLIEFVEPVIRERQEEIVEKMKIYGQICLNCSFDDADKCPSCKIMKDEIATDHRFNRPTFRNTSIKDCFTNPWELAKCYMAAGNDMVRNISDTDTVGFLQLIVNNMIFQHHTSENLNNMNNIFQQVREVRNSIMHSPENRTTKQTFENQVKVIVRMLQSLHTSSSKRIIPKVKQLQTDKVSLEDIHHANSEAVKFFKSYEAELRERIKECEYRMTEIEDTISRGEKQIGESIERGVDTIREQTEQGEKAVQDATNLATKRILEETDVGIQKLDDKANQSTRILEEKERVLDKHFKESTEQLGEEISKIKDAKNEAMEALDKAEEIKKTVKVIDEKTNNDIAAIQKVAQLCMENICDQSKASGETMQATQDKLDDEFKQRMHKTIGNQIEKCETQMTKKMADADIAVNKMTAELKQFESYIMKKVEDAHIRMNEKLAELKQLESYIRKNSEDIDNRMDKKTSRYERISINISHTDDISPHSIVGMAKMNARRLAVVDRGNRSVKIIDVEKHSVDDHLKLSEWPLVIACIDETQLVVACVGGNLLFLRLDGRLNEVNKVQLESRPLDVVCLNGEIGVLFGEPKVCFKILSFSGETKRTCTEGLMKPTHIATNRSKTTLYVPDTEDKCIKMIDLNDGQQLLIFGKIDLSQIGNPTCLTVDQNDNVYVVVVPSQRIVRISPDRDIKTLIDGQVLPAIPKSLEYCQTQNKLYVGFEKKNILCFNIVDK